MDVIVIVDPVARRGTPRRKVMPSLLLRLGTLGPSPIGVVAKGVAAAPPYLWGVCV